jgi:lysophospholipase L1-like esterase
MTRIADRWTFVGDRILAATACVAALGCVAGPAAAAAPFAATRPTVRVEYWQQRVIDITAELERTRDLSSVRLLFLGDSITDFWSLDDNPWFPGKKCGRRIWDESFAGRVPENRGLNLGVSGDRTEHVLYRILPKAAGGLGELDAPELDPEFVVLLVGINNTWAAETPMLDSTFEGIRAVVTAVHERKPRATVILQSLLPTPEVWKNHDVIEPVNHHLAVLATEQPFSGYVRFFDLHAAFVDPSGEQIDRYFNDGLHPSEAGYRAWRDRLVPLIARLRAATRPAAVPAT